MDESPFAEMICFEIVSLQFVGSNSVVSSAIVVSLMSRSILPAGHCRNPRNRAALIRRQRRRARACASLASPHLVRLLEGGLVDFDFASCYPGRRVQRTRPRQPGASDLAAPWAWLVPHGRDQPSAPSQCVVGHGSSPFGLPASPVKMLVRLAPVVCTRAIYAQCVRCSKSTSMSIRPIALRSRVVVRQ